MNHPRSDFDPIEAIVGSIVGLINLIVIPANAGIHFDFQAEAELHIRMDPSLRWDDERWLRLAMMRQTREAQT
jgi:hypothetical protein